MKRAVVITVLLVTAISSKAQQANSGWPGEILEGTWLMATKTGFTGETWKKIDENYYQSTGFIVKGHDTIITEKVALQRITGGIYYISTVENQNNKEPVSFKLTSSVNNIFTFENPAHDFPKRIVYAFTDTVTLHAYIDDGTGNKRQDYYFKKEK
ncbi:MAG: DUF6265 family protein [Ferruginibacter sp.]